jgi:aspartate-semialdehyde dehydrogenase
MAKIKVAVLGATGMIGQRFVQLLEDHPSFEIGGLYASERSEGKKLGDALKIKDYAFKSETLGLKIEQLDVKKIAERCRAAFSGLPTDIAGDFETQLASSGVAVFSNAAPHRMGADVPLLIPECNADHLAMIKSQKTFKDGGYIVTNANCSTTGIALPLKAIDLAFGLKFVSVSTYQAVSGAGYPGVPSLDILGNVVPYIKSEEEKMEMELAKILGKVKDGKFVDHPVQVLANCARVPVVDGHLESLVLQTGKDVSVEQMIDALEEFTAVPQELVLPTAPVRPVIVRKEENRPQPAIDVNAGEPARARGMSTVVGRVRKKDNYYKMFVLSHNTIQGGAGGSVLNAELALAKKLL